MGVSALYKYKCTLQIKFKVLLSSVSNKKNDISNIEILEINVFILHISSGEKHILDLNNIAGEVIIW